MTLFRVYGWRNIHTDEWYIGQTNKYLKKRSMSDGSGYKGYGVFSKAIKEYGWGAFEENILRLCTSQEEADYWEKYYIKEKNSIYPNGYNMVAGGKSGYKFHPTSIEKRNQTMRDKQRY